MLTRKRSFNDATRKAINFILATLFNVLLIYSTTKEMRSTLTLIVLKFNESLTRSVNGEKVKIQNAFNICVTIFLMLYLFSVQSIYFHKWYHVVLHVICDKF